MSITIVSFPPSGAATVQPTPAQIPMIVEVNESDASVVKMEITFTPIITGIGARYTQFGDIDNDQDFTFDIQDPVEDSMSHDLQVIDAPGQLTTSNSMNAVTLNFNSFNEVAGVLTLLNVVSFSSNIIFTLNANRQYLETQDLENYWIDFIDATRKFLTNSPASKPIFINESEFLSAFTRIPVTASVRITKTNKDGSTVDLDTGLTLAATGDERWDFGVGPANINALSAGFIDSDVVSYDVKVLNPLDAQVTEAKTYVIQSGCPINPIRVHFLNWLGGFDSFTFEGIGKQDIKTTKKTYKKFLPSGFTNGDRGTTTLKIKANRRITARSTPLTLEQRQWLEELITSQEVFIVDDDGYIPVVQQTGTFVTDDQRKDLQRLFITLDYSNEVITGRA